MLNYSVLAENTERVSKRCIWFLVLGLIAIISVAALALGYFVLSSTQKSEATDKYDSCTSNRTALQDAYHKLNITYNQKKTMNEELTAKLKTEREKNVELIDNTNKTAKEFEEVSKQLSRAKAQLGIYAGASSASIAATAYLLPSLLSAPSRLRALRSEYESIVPKYLSTIPYSLSHFIYPKEGGGEHGLRLLYNSENNFAREQFVSKVTDHANTVTLIKTKAKEVMAFFLLQPWSFSGEILDSQSFTFSFRKFFKTTKHDADSPAVKNQGFLWVGDREIILEEKGTGEAVVGNGYDPPEIQGNPSDFYVGGGNFELDNMVVYEFTQSG